MTQPTHKSLAKAVLIFGGAQMLTVLAALVRSKVAAVTVGATGVGLAALYTAIAGLMNNICNLGLPDSGVQTLSKSYATGREEDVDRTIGLLRLWGVITGGAAMLLTMAFSPLLCMLYFGSVGSHLHSVLFLSLVPAATILTAIETTILKSLQQTRKLTFSISASAIISVLVSVPLYILMGWDGIIFIIVATSVLSMLVTMLLSWRVTSVMPDFALLRSGFASLWKESKAMLILGMVLVITGVGSMGVELMLQTYFTTVASLAAVGLYKSGYQLSITYPGMIFTALSNDYYPRLASMTQKTTERNILATKQTRVLLMMVTPCIVLFIILLPVIVPLMLSHEFDAIIPMVRIGAVSIIVRCVTLPLGFMPLASGQKWDFVWMELASYAALFACVIVGWHTGGLIGVGVGIVLSNVFDYVYALCLCRVKYGFRYTVKA